MRTTHIRNMFDLHRNKIAVCLVAGLFVLLAMNPATAQFKKGSNYNYKEFSKKPYYFGITLGYNKSNYRVFHSDQFILNDSLSVAQSITGPGFNLGIVTNLKIGEYFDFRLLPTLSFAERKLQYADARGRSTFTRKIESVFAEIPFHVRYKSAPFRDKRVFLIAGVKYAFDVASNSKTRQADELIKISPTDFSVEYGFGVQFFFPFFIFSPEFKISQGISNILLRNPQLEESNVLDKVLSRAFTISIHFEG